MNAFCKSIAVGSSLSVILVVAPTLQADSIQTWTNPNAGSWSVNSSWSPFGIPNGLEDSALIGDDGNAINNWVFMDTNVQLGALQITDGMTLKIDGTYLNMSGGDTIVSGQNQVGNIIYSSRIQFYPREVNNYAGVFDFLYVENGARLSFEDNAYVTIDTHLKIGDDSSAGGWGKIFFHNNVVPALRNDGAVYGQESFTLQALDGAYFDLDGLAGDGYISTAVNGHHITINGNTYNFGGNIVIGSGSTTTFDREFTMEIEGSPDETEAFVILWGEPGNPATLIGTQINAHQATFNVRGVGVIDADFYTQDGFEMQVGDGFGSDDSFTVTGSTLLTGGVFYISDDSTLNLPTISNNNDTNFVLEGGTMEGDTLKNNDSMGIVGYGTVNNRLVNETFIAANGGTLVVNGDNNLWDGAGNQGQLLAMTGDLHITDYADEVFVGELRVAEGHELYIDGFEFYCGPLSHVQMFGGTIGGTHKLSFGNLLEVFNNSYLDTESYFTSSSTSELWANLTLDDGGLIHAGATITGTGMLVGGENEYTAFENGASIDVDFMDKGILIIDLLIGEATVNGNVFQLGEIQFLLGEPVDGQYDHLNVTETFEARGHFNVVMYDYMPQLNDEYDILDFTTFVDLGYTMSLPQLPASLAWDVSDFETDGIVRVGINTCPADINHDGTVSTSDLLILLTAWGTDDLAADLNEDGLVSTTDLLFLLSSWGDCP